MPNVRRLLAGLLLLTPLAGAADPALLDFIMPDARVVVGIDIAHIRSSPLNASFSNGVQNANPEIQKLMDAAGFDPLRDLQEILFASPGIGKNPPALLVARGTFDIAKLRAFAESAGSKISDFGGVPILSDPEKDSGAFALLDNIILGGNRAQVEAAIGRRGRGLILNTEMATRIAALSHRYDAWLVSIAPLATMASSLPPDAKVEGLTTTEALRAIEQFSLGISMSSDLSLAAELVMVNAKAAGSIADGLQMLMGIAQKGAQEEPGLMSVLKNLNLGVDRNVVHLGFTVPVAEVEKAVQSAMNSQMKKSPPMTAALKPAPGLPTIQSQPAPMVVQEQQTQAQIPDTQQPQTQPEPAAQAMVEPATQPEPETAAQSLAQPGPEPATQVAAQPVAERAPPAPLAPPAPKVAGTVIKSARIPANGEILIQSSPKDMGTVVIIGSQK